MNGLYPYRRWMSMSLLNFLLVALIGILLRYKVAFSLPVVNYKYLLHAHSHFAFSGWITTALFTALVYVLSQSGVAIGRAYTHMFRLLQLSSFGMLLSFPVQGYGAVSIFFSVLGMVFSWWFAWRYYKDMRRSTLRPVVRKWIGASLLFYVLSGAGPLLLGYCMVRHLGQVFYFNSVYFFLHFQYNGWFSFALGGLLFHVAGKYEKGFEGNMGRWLFRLMAMACIPAYCLSVLWMSPPKWVVAIAVWAAVVQGLGLAIFVRLIRRCRRRWSGMLPGEAKWFWGLAGAAWVIKILLQGLTVIPAAGNFAFGFRPVIIAYLHLVMLVFASLFLVGFFLREGLLNSRPVLWKYGSILFVSGVLINEMFLLWDALPVLRVLFIHPLTLLLLAVACLMWLGLLCMLLSQNIFKLGNG
ncbi:MAG TPA: hypothetical protein VHC48_10955 [Puia sp.]|nr:hypothetical protein [Puia sp.]